MNASYEEKSAWVQLVGLTIGAGVYAAVAAGMMRGGEGELTAFIPLFVSVTVLVIVLTIVGNIIAASTGGDQRDERDKLIAWRAGSRAAQFLAFGAMLAAVVLTLNVPRIWVAHGLLALLFVSEGLRCVLQLIAYRRGF